MEPIELNWPGGEDAFLFRLAELEALDDKTEAGVLDFRFRLHQGVSRGSLAFAPVKIREVLDCLRLGLIGAGMDREKAAKKVRAAFDGADFSLLAVTAYTAVSHSIAGKAHDPLDDGEGDEAGEAQAGERPPA